jgi:hypothetical protein
VDALLKAIATAIASNSGTFVISGLIGVYGIWEYVRFRRGVRALVASVRTATGRLEQVAGKQEFATTFQDLDDEFKAHALLGHGWTQFVDSLVEPGPDERPHYRNPHEAGEYFSAEGVAQGSVNIRYFQAVPGYLTGLGILGTFIGLVAGIYLAGGGLAESDAAKTRQALSALLSGASVAFFTSIVGLIGSLIFSGSEKYQLHELEKEVDRWCGALDRRVQRVTPEHLVALQLSESFKQTRQLERFNTDLATSIAAALEEKLAADFTPRLTRLVSGVEQLRDRQESFSSSLVDAVTSNVRQVSGAAGDQMRDFSETIAGLVSVMRETTGGLASGQSRMAEAVESVITRLEASYGQSTNVLTTETSRTIDRLVQALESAGSAASNDVKSAGSSLSATLSEAAARVSSQFATAGGAAAAQLTDAGSSAAANVKDAAGVLSQTMTELSSRLLVQMDQAGGKAAEHLTVATSNLTNGFERASSSAAIQMTEAGATAAASVKDASVVLSQTMAELASRLLEKMDAAGGKAAEHLTSASASLTSGFHQASQAAATHISSASQQSATALSAAGQSAAESLLTSTQLSADTLRTAATEAAKLFADSSVLVSASAGRFGEAANRLNEIQRTHAEGMQEVQAVLREFREVHGAFRASAQPLADAVASLRSVGSTLEQQVAAGKDVHAAFAASALSIRGAQEHMQEAWRQYENRFEQMDESLGAVVAQMTDGARSYTDTVKEFVQGIDGSFKRSLDQLSGVLADLDDAIQAFAQVSVGRQ